MKWVGAELPRLRGDLVTWPRSHGEFRKTPKTQLRLLSFLFPGVPFVTASLTLYCFLWIRDQGVVNFGPSWVIMEKSKTGRGKGVPITPKLQSTGRAVSNYPGGREELPSWV